jgi:hypothetical protein
LAEKTTNDDSILELSVRNDFSFYVNFFAVAAVGSTVFLFLRVPPSSFFLSRHLFSLPSIFPIIAYSLYLFANLYYKERKIRQMV